MTSATLSLMGEGGDQVHGAEMLRRHRIARFCEDVRDHGGLLTLEELARILSAMPAPFAATSRPSKNPASTSPPPPDKPISSRSSPQGPALGKTDMKHRTEEQFHKS